MHAICYGMDYISSNSTDFGDENCFPFTARTDRQIQKLADATESPTYTTVISAGMGN